MAKDNQKQTYNFMPSIQSYTDASSTSASATTPAPASGARYGQPIYQSNPSILAEEEIRKPRRSRIGTEQKGLVVDTGTGEVLGQGGAYIYEWEEVDKERFVKLYSSGLKSVLKMSKAGQAVFELVYKRVSEAKEQDLVALSPLDAKLRQGTYYRGLKELLDLECLYRSPNPGLYWVNIRYMFNGDRLAFVKGYKLRKDDRQLDLLEGGTSPTKSVVT